MASEQRIYWRHSRRAAVAVRVAGMSSVVMFDSDPSWQRVHVLTPEELAARDAEKWDEGWRIGARDQDEGIDTPNPYREAGGWDEV